MIQQTDISRRVEVRHRGLETSETTDIRTPFKIRSYLKPQQPLSACFLMKLGAIHVYKGISAALCTLVFSRAET